MSVPKPVRKAVNGPQHFLRHGLGYSGLSAEILSPRSQAHARRFQNVSAASRGRDELKHGERGSRRAFFGHGISRPAQHAGWPYARSKWPRRSPKTTSRSAHAHHS